MLCIFLFATSIANVLCVPSDPTAAISKPAEAHVNGRFNQSPNNLFESIWRTFKQTFESTSNALSTISSSYHTSRGDDSMEDPHQQHREDFSNRRRQLLERSLSDHYTKLFVQSSLQLSNSYELQNHKVHNIPDEDIRDTASTSSSSSSLLSSTPSSSHAARSATAIRWEQKSNTLTPGSTCYCFSESRKSYWSFQWCPHVEVLQGRRGKDGLLHPRYSLGRPSNIVNTGGQVVRGRWHNRRPPSLAEVAELGYPDAVGVEMYVGGDPCDTETGLLRTSVVVIHKHTSDQCPDDVVDNANDDPIRAAPMMLARVDELRICEYVVHVCMLPPPPIVNRQSSDADGNTADSISSSSYFDWASAKASITESDAKEINRTIGHLQLTVDSYLHQTEADAIQKKSADVLTSLHLGLPPMPQSKVRSNLKLIKDMVMHAYDGYFYHGFPASEVKPITCKPSSFSLVKIPGLTLIDSLDTLVIVGNYSEFARAVERLKQLNDHMAKENGSFGRGGLFALNQNVSVFETNIRVLGGLLSSHQLAEAYLNRRVFQHQVWADDKSILFGNSGNEECEYVIEAQESPSSRSDCDSSSTFNCQQESTPKEVCRNRTSSYWVYDGFLLELARDIGDRLLPAFDTPTGIPYGTVNLLSGIPEGETTVASLAGGGTLSLEMELLSRLTGNEEYGRAAKLAARALWMRRSPCGLLGKHICTRRGEWTETLSGIGSNSDSYYEYLIKHHILFPEDEDFWVQLVSAYSGVHSESRLGEWYGDVDMGRGNAAGGGSRRVFEALMAFYPGMQVLLGEVTPAARTLNSFFLVREHLGFLPERFNYGAWKVDAHGGKHLLRPELLESAYFLHRASKGVQHQFRSRGNNTSRDASGWQWAGDFALHTLEKLTRTQCGYGSLLSLSSTTTGALNADRNKVKLLNEMPSYFLSETLKYLYLLFDDNNMMHSDEDRDWIFTTEAHPIHHEVDRKRVTMKSILEEQKISLQQRLRSRLKRVESASPAAFDGLYSEKWTDGSNFRTYREQLEPLWVAGYNTYSETRKTNSVSENAALFSPHVTEPFLPHESSLGIFDKFNERLGSLNPSYLSFPSLGRHIALTKACPNLYLTDLLWIRALNGGITDYADTYLSRVQDGVAVLGLSSVILGSVDALALHGAGVHIKSMFDPNCRCPVRDPKGEYGNRSTDSESPAEQKTNSGLAQIDMGEGLGSFEVSAFPGGTGFFVQQVDTGETVMVSFIEGEVSPNEGETYVLVYSSYGDGRNDEEQEESKDDFVASRTVVMADLKGSAYSCVVQIVESTMEDSTTCSRYMNERSVHTPPARQGGVIAQFPCAPALFGPSHVSHLRQMDTIYAEAVILSPKVGDEFGCDSSGEIGLDENAEVDEPTGDDEVCKYSVIQMVHRGICTFQQKSRNQKHAGRAEAVVVINSEDNELFVMSGGDADETSNTMDKDDFPLTVLVTGSDGQSIIDIVDSFVSSEHSQLVARVTLVRGSTELTTSENGALTVTGNRFWPAVRANADGVQIFSRSGWGIHSVLKPSGGNSLEREWQLFLLKHSTQS